METHAGVSRGAAGSYSVLRDCFREQAFPRTGVCHKSGEISRVGRPPGQWPPKSRGASWRLLEAPDARGVNELENSTLRLCRPTEEPGKSSVLESTGKLEARKSQLQFCSELPLSCLSFGTSGIEHRGGL